MTTAEKIAVMQAFEQGKKIEFRKDPGRGEWTPTGNPTWNWAFFEYRIRPDSRTIYAVEDPDGQLSAYGLTPVTVLPGPGYRSVQFVEVPE